MEGNPRNTEARDILRVAVAVVDSRRLQDHQPCLHLPVLRLRQSPDIHSTAYKEIFLQNARRVHSVERPYSHRGLRACSLTRLPSPKYALRMSFLPSVSWRVLVVRRWMSVRMGVRRWITEILILRWRAIIGRAICPIKASSTWNIQGRIRSREIVK